jgi:hypothetical protein
MMLIAAGLRTVIGRCLMSQREVRRCARDTLLLFNGDSCRGADDQETYLRAREHPPSDRKFARRSGRHDESCMSATKAGRGQTPR